jgi:hypothetical protein
MPTKKSKKRAAKNKKLRGKSLGGVKTLTPAAPSPLPIPYPNT